MKNFLRFIREAFTGPGQRTNLLILFNMFIFIIILARLFNLQIINGEYYEDNYVQKSIKYITIPASRGNIYDKDGKILAYNELVYNLTIADVDAYKQNNRDINRRNRMLLQLSNILDKYQVNIDSKYYVEIDKNNNFVFTSANEGQHKTFIANVYGRRVADLDEGSRFRYKSNISPREAFEYSKKRYAMDRILDDNNIPMIIDDKTILKMIGIHYTMRLTSYQKYQPTTIATNIPNRCATEILENLGTLKGVDIEESSIRRYNYSIYFAHIIGYIGKTSEARINRLKEINSQYDLNDRVGLLGVEKSMESVLCGTKGYRKIIVESGGRILETLEEEESKAGNDVYLSISVNDQIANYHLLEQRLAGIVASKIVNRDVENRNLGSSSMMISAHDAYYHLIDNNVLDKEHFMSDNAQYAEKEIYRIFKDYKERARTEIYRNLTDKNALIQSEIPNDIQNYTAYIYNYLHTHNNILMSDAIDRDVDEYKRWKEDTISLRDFLLKAIEEVWIDSTKIYASERYGDRDTIYMSLVNYIMNFLNDNDEFDKLLYRFAIKQDYITNRLLCMALYEQEFLPYDETEYQKLLVSNDEYVFTFFVRLIRDLRLKPSDLALDPYNGSIVISDVNTGKLKALVTYPSYDNNLITNRSYLDKLNNNKSYPLVSCSTQTQLAPGSSFKPVTSVAALEEGVITKDTKINCTGIFDEIDPPIRCWAYPYSHGELDLYNAISNSCNVYFSILGHMMSFDKDNNYSTDNGLRILQKYCRLFGLDKKSGVEIDEMEPTISYTDPERSAMGQGTHAYNNVQLARFTCVLANGGTLIDLSLLDKVMDKKNNVIETFEPKIIEKVNFQQSNIKTVHEGMRLMITDGITKLIFRNQGIQVVGKTGTAQERNDRTNHAVFISFAPEFEPSVSVNIVIPFGYSSGNAASLANRVYDYIFGVTSFESIISQNADNIRSISVSE